MWNSAFHLIYQTILRDDTKTIKDFLIWKLVLFIFINLFLSVLSDLRSLIKAVWSQFSFHQSNIVQIKKRHLKKVSYTTNLRRIGDFDSISNELSLKNIIESMKLQKNTNLYFSGIVRIEALRDSLSSIACSFAISYTSTNANNGYSEKYKNFSLNAEGDKEGKLFLLWTDWQMMSRQTSNERLCYYWAGPPAVLNVASKLNNMNHEQYYTWGKTFCSPATHSRN